MVFELLTERTGGAISQTKSYISNREIVLKKKGTSLLHLLPDDVLVRLPLDADHVGTRVAGLYQGRANLRRCRIATELELNLGAAREVDAVVWSRVEQGDEA